MKNIKNLKELQGCNVCNLKGFFCYTPQGADFNTCPCCGENDFLNDSNSSKYDFLGEVEYDDDMRNKYSYCKKCRIIFQVGCMHNCMGCTSNVYNGHFIQKWKDNTNTNDIHEGMPQFDNVDDWFNNVNNVNVLQMYCPHKNAKCTKSYYDVNKYECDLSV